MTSQSFNRPGAVDLSSLSAAAPAGGGSYVTDIDEASFDAVVGRSMQHPVIIELYSPRDTGGQQVSSDLASLAGEAGGKWLLGRVDVDAQPRIAQALGVQAVPTVIAIIGGQLAPLFQGTKAKAEISAVLDQVMQLAVANGIVGRAEPVAAAASPGSPDAPAVDPRFAAADEAMMAGDYAKAVAEFDKLLAQTPNDPEATAGRAQAALLQRSLGFDPARIAERATGLPKDLDAAFDAADLDIIQGNTQAAFDRLLGLFADVDPDGKEKLRLRLLELFEVVGRADPKVLSARRRLMSALF